MGIGMRELLVILLVALLVFGTKKLKTIGSDLGGAVRGFKKAMEEGENEKPEPPQQQKAPEQIATDPARASQAASSAGAAKNETVS